MQETNIFKNKLNELKSKKINLLYKLINYRQRIKDIYNHLYVLQEEINLDLYN